MALDTSINFTKPVRVGDVLTAEANERHHGKTTGLYLISVSNQHGDLVAHFKGLCYRTGKRLIEDIKGK
jgi:acyl-CoA thioesterase